MAPATNAPGLIDTSVLVDAERGRIEAVDLIAAHESAGAISISIVSSMELIAGARNARELKLVKQFLQRCTALPLSANASQTAQQLMEKFS